MDIRELERLAIKARIHTIQAIADLGIGHSGGSMSIVEVLTAPYYTAMDAAPEQPGRPDWRSIRSLP